MRSLASLSLHSVKGPVSKHQGVFNESNYHGALRVNTEVRIVRKDFSEEVIMEERDVSFSKGTERRSQGRSACV